MSHIGIDGKTPVFGVNISKLENSLSQGQGFGSHRQSMQISEKKADITLKTREGDTVTLSYQTTRVTKNYLRGVGTQVNGLQDSLNTYHRYSMHVDGDLNDEELSDIEAFQEEVNDVLEGFLSRNIAESLDPETLNLSRYEALEKYAVALESGKSLSWATKMVTAQSQSVTDDMVISRQRTEKAVDGNNYSSFQLEENNNVIRQEGTQEFEYRVSDMQKQSVVLKAENTNLLQNNQRAVRYEAYNRYGQINQPVTPLDRLMMDTAPILNDYTNIRNATSKVFSSHIGQVKGEAMKEELRSLEKEFLSLTS